MVNASWNHLILGHMKYRLVQAGKQANRHKGVREGKRKIKSHEKGNLSSKEEQKVVTL